MNVYYSALLGGIILGIGVATMMLFKGRVFGVSGLVGALVKPVKGEISWRVSAVVGLILGGFFMVYIEPNYIPTIEFNVFNSVAAGVLVGVGTQMGSGCTSGHGICGISRFSKRSIVATCTFMLAGIITVAVKGAF